MASIATTKLSSKGQVVIPEEIRKQLGLKEGDQFVVVGQDDAVILKSIKKPVLNEFDSLIDKARRQARDARLKRSDIGKAIAKVRTAS
ncbi:MAG: AbrB/MazE/SpoVT family DNA-binding domain-containing protein [Nitrospiraceae bacterium]|jgi:AbrB family looped-hinge helix DNA binding protein|uniref:AbrB/MazE/SpoVT family DNA-binding domain-containing protein n=1 Tax=Candidatus Nitrospira neomarina TaxID=3020899 RepID=A0AA96K0F1_9BACT|nr:AbrB/MazE/SpoVT family DNA-binding domain-containing protein [Candidatus Nitrospira neomarina]MCA9456913.1 AbrB/MazE/SpoVT family DNA-binding domain-containing protein [Nitrospira sp.]MCB9773041.1 AbrB/MazE/SpoVT family DNA-binding domain-containing protein [Nitrospiraceae bacterium]MDH3503871.1 AbrB/MazE/SpoVT family DNA-binding domain-containing protein [Nitrospirota bacterium]MDH5700184.1 AbrB/MazE/SpoVT family DNA-binding domain-containing protein [Nitrospirota bacterium]WNM62011.1 AbrB